MGLALKQVYEKIREKFPEGVAEIVECPGDPYFVLKPEAVVPVCGKLEAEIAELPADEAVAFRAALGVTEPALHRVVKATYDLLGLISFFTTGEDEVRAWTVPANTPAQLAAGAIHSDLERGFIRAEVIRWDELLRAGSEASAKKLGIMRTEGKSYPIRDGDCLHVLFNV